MATIEHGLVTLQGGYRSTYNVESEVSSIQRNGVGLGILLDSSNTFERFQAIGPNSSSFSGEDLSSDYLGFYSEATGTDLGQLIAQLGAPEVAQKPSGMPKNYSHTPLIRNMGAGWSNSAWPAALTITPIDSSSGLWRRSYSEMVGSASIGGFPNLPPIGFSDVSIYYKNGWTVAP